MRRSWLRYCGLLGNRIMQNFNEIWSNTMALIDDTKQTSLVEIGCKIDTAIKIIDCEKLSDVELLEKINDGEF